MSARRADPRRGAGAVVPTAWAAGATGAATAAVVVLLAATVVFALGRGGGHPVALTGRRPVHAAGGPVAQPSPGAPGASPPPATRVVVAGRSLEVSADAEWVRVCLVRPRRCVDASSRALRSGSPEAVTGRLDDGPSLLLALLPDRRVPIGRAWVSAWVPRLRARVVVAAVDPSAGGVCLAYRGPGGRLGTLAVTRTARAGVGLLVRRPPCERATVGADPGGVHEPRDHDQP